MFTQKRGINTEIRIYGQTNEQVKVKFLVCGLMQYEHGTNIFK